MLRLRSARALLAALLVLLTGALATGCLESAPAPPRPPQPTPIGELDTAGMTIPRISFCDLLPETVIEQAVAGEIGEFREWGTGDPAAPATDTAGDVSHEFGCSWRSTDGTAARAWVFGRPVTADFAAKVARQTAAKHDCRTPDGPAFGQPSQLQVCQMGGGVLRVRHAGLFGDTWLSCEISAPAIDPADVRARAGAWCVQVANALDTASRATS